MPGPARGDKLAVMTAKDIITIPNPLLRERSRRVNHIDADTRALATNMIGATLDWESGREHETAAALAAVQIGQAYRVVIIRDNFEDKQDKSFSVYINPEIVKAEGEPEEEMEGCLSVKDIYGSVLRHPKVKIKALNLDGKPVRLTATGFLARVFQHEIDHTNGIVFVDRISDPSKLFHLESDGKFTPLNPLDHSPHGRA
jgi:peptide deformylase